MERIQLKKHWEVIEAYMNGAVIEVNTGEGWNQLDNPSFMKCFEYRVKKEPEYIPFDFSDAEMLIGKAVKQKTDKYTAIINAVFDSTVLIGNCLYTYTNLLEKFTFLDATPCGKIKS